MSYAIETRALAKRFGSTRALDEVDLRIREGSVYGLLGPNGAGKTTTIRILATLLKPTAGTATVFGHDVVREAKVVRQKVSLTGQFASVDEDLTGQPSRVGPINIHYEHHGLLGSNVGQYRLPVPLAEFKQLIKADLDYVRGVMAKVGI